MAAPGLGAGDLDLSASATETTVVRGGSGAAAAAGSPNTLTLQGKPVDGRVVVFSGAAGRLTVISPEGVVAPSGTTMCTQDSATQISCDPGYIGAITGQLLEGNDTFKLAQNLNVILGVVLDGQPRPLDGGPGRDRIVGAAAPDHLVGGPGQDTLIGNGNGDLLDGGTGRDKLKGGPGKDFCIGGPGIDVGQSCTAGKQIP
jgi:Ca2+-binding RTX toxin-like protein